MRIFTSSLNLGLFENLFKRFTSYSRGWEPLLGGKVVGSPTCPPHWPAPSSRRVPPVDLTDEFLRVHRNIHRYGDSAAPPNWPEWDIQKVWDTCLEQVSQHKWLGHSLLAGPYPIHGCIQAGWDVVFLRYPLWQKSGDWMKVRMIDPNNVFNKCSVIQKGVPMVSGQELLAHWHV